MDHRTTVHHAYVQYCTSTVRTYRTCLCTVLYTHCHSRLLHYLVAANL
jgi:hypothetical protein